MIEVSYDPRRRTTDSIELPLSKSISNRLLILQKLYPGTIDVPEHSDSIDTVILQRALEGGDARVDFGISGTSARFFLAYAALRNDRRIIDASGRGRNRPIRPLFESLEHIGAEFEYLEEPYHFPVRLRKAIAKGGPIAVDMESSSQFASALALIAPQVPGGLFIKLQGKQSSMAYLEMTIDVLRQLGCLVTYDGSEISIPYQNEISPQKLKVERDWSAAAYVFEHLLLKAETNPINLPGLKHESMQADRQIVDYLSPYGIKVKTTDNALRVYRSQIAEPEYGAFDFGRCPDLSVALAFTWAAAKVNVRLTGLNTLRDKESDRWRLLEYNISRISSISVDQSNWSVDIGHKNKAFFPPDKLIFQTAGDHRFVMAMSVLAEKSKPVYLNEIESVEKSFPQFVDQFTKLGYSFKRHR